MYKLTILALLVIGRLCFGSTIAVSDYGDHSGVDQAGVAAAIAAASSGDTVQLSAGTATWTGGVTIDKALTLAGQSSAPPGQGSGSSSTKIIRSGNWMDSTGRMVVIAPKSDVPIRVTAIHFDQNAPYVSYTNLTAVFIVAPDTGFVAKQIRVDNCSFNTGTQVVWWNGAAYGVVDHCSFTNCWICIMIYGGSGDLGDSAFARNDYQAGSLNFPFAEDCVFTWNMPGGYPGSPWVTYHWAGGRSVLRHCLIDGTGAASGITGPVDCHGNQSYWHPDSNNQRGTIRFEFYKNTVKLGPGIYQVMDLRGGSHLIHDNTFSTSDGATPNVGDFREEESDPGNTPGIPVRSPVQWPAEDQISNSFIWGNTLNGSAHNNVGVGWFGNGDAQSGDPFYIKVDRDYWLKEPEGSKTSYPAPGAPSVAQYPSPYASLAITSYAEAPYPHPLTKGSLPAPSPTATPAPTPTPPRGTIAAVQAAYTEQSTSAKTIAATFPKANTAGNCIVVSLGWTNGTGTPISKVSDTAGNTYRLGIGPTTAGVNRAMYYASDTRAHPAGNKVTVTFSAADTGAQMVVAEFGGVGIRGALLDGTAGRNVTSATPSSGPITTSRKGDLLVMGWWADHATPSPGAGFTQLVNEPWNAGMEYMVSGAPGPYDGTLLQNPSVNGSYQMIALKQVGSLPVPTPTPDATPTPSPAPSASPTPSWEKWIEKQNDWIRNNPPTPDP